VMVALSRSRQPRYALALLWIGVMLIPTIVTTGAPNFTRTLGALPMVFALPGFMVEWLLFWAPRLLPLQYYQTVSRVTTAIIVLGLLVVLSINAASTYEDYFIKWPQHPETQFVFQADFAAIAKDIDASDVIDVSVGGLSNDTMDDPSLYLLRQRKDVRVRWFDSGSPISSGGAIVEAYAPIRRVYIPSIVPVSPLLELTTDQATQSYVTSHFKRYETRSNFRPGQPPWTVRFSDTARLLSKQDIDLTLEAGSTAQFETAWTASPPILFPRRTFVHLVDPATDRIVAQHDGLDSPTKYWLPWDWSRQVHTLTIPAETPPGRYELRLGLYDPSTGRRVPIESDPLSDYVILGTIEVTR